MMQSSKTVRASLPRSQQAGNTATVATPSANATFTDENTVTTTPPDDAPSLAISASDNTAEEGAAGDYVVFDIDRTGATEVDTTFTFTLGGDIEAADVSSLEYSTDGGTTWTAFSDGDTLTLPAGDADNKIQVRVLPVDDAILEFSESLTATIAATGNTATVATPSANATFTDENTVTHHTP